METAPFPQFLPVAQRYPAPRSTDSTAAIPSSNSATRATRAELQDGYGPGAHHEL